MERSLLDRLVQNLGRFLHNLDRGFRRCREKKVGTAGRKVQAIIIYVEVLQTIPSGAEDVRLCWIDWQVYFGNTPYQNEKSSNTNTSTRVWRKRDSLVSSIAEILPYLSHLPVSFPSCSSRGRHRTRSASLEAVSAGPCFDSQCSTCPVGFGSRGTNK